MIDMLWFILSLLTAIFESAKDLSSKRALQKLDEYVAAFALRFFALPFLLPLLFFIDWSHDIIFWQALFVTVSLNIITTILYMKAIKISPLSITIPMVTFTPAFLLLTSPLILGEFPNIYGVVGILLVVLGSYTLNIRDVKKGFLAPFRALARERGPILMLMAVFIWSITANFDKIAIMHSSPIFFVVNSYVFLSLGLLPIALKKSKYIKHSSGNIKYLLPIGFFAALMSIFQMTAFSIALVAYVIAIKRMSSVFTTLGGHFFFKEIRIRERLLGVCIMVLGVLLITLFP